MIRVIDEIGSAEAATSPSHGSNNPTKETAVNRGQATTAPGIRTRAPFDFEAAFCRLENPILDTRERVNALCVLTDLMQGAPINGGGYVVFGDQELDALRFLIGEVRLAVQVLDAAWTEGQPPPPSVLTRFDDLDEQTQLETLIGSHRNAARELEVAIIEGRKSGAAYDETERYKLANEEDVRTFDNLLKWRPKTAEGNAQRLRYVFGDKESPWSDSIPEEAKLRMLLGSMMEAA